MSTNEPIRKFIFVIFLSFLAPSTTSFFAKLLEVWLQNEVVACGKNKKNLIKKQLTDRFMPYTRLDSWVKSVQELTRPERVHLVDGSDEEMGLIEKELISKGTFLPLNPKLRPHSFLARSNPDDVARVEDRTFICSKSKDDAGVTNNWVDPDKMKKTLQLLFGSCMKGRTMYVVPFCMGPIGSPYSRIGVEITDSPYVVANMRLMTRMGKAALDRLGDQDFVKCLHSVGKPLELDQRQDESNDSWPCNTENLYIAHFPETNEVWSFGSGYGGNALLNKKSFALRIASKIAKTEGWLAEHMLIVGITNPAGSKRYFAASFPSACGKTNLSMLQPTLPGWKVECVGDDIAWMHWGKDGKLYAINPEAGFFGVAPGTSYTSNPNAMRTIEKTTIFTNVALTDEGDVWWEGKTDAPPQHLVSWTGKSWTPSSKEKAAHPNARFTVASSQCPIIDPDWEKPEGVPISGIIFGGRRSETIPLVRKGLSWQHGVFMAASMTSELTAASKGEVGKVRHDPFAMLPFCGYNMADYFAHWLSMQNRGYSLPGIFYVNWFLKDKKGKFVWPGFGENIRVLKWCFESLDGTQDMVKTPIGYLPTKTGISKTGLDLSLLSVSYDALFDIDRIHWKQEARLLVDYFEQFGPRLPGELRKEAKTLQDAFAS